MATTINARDGWSRISLPFILVVAAIARFWRLDAKPLWLDEIITTLICLGRGPSDVPVDRPAPFTLLPRIFTPRPGAGWTTVAHILSDPGVQHTHPPLFYFVMNAWFRLMPPAWGSLAWDVRVIPAVFGVAAVAAMAGTLRTAYPQRAGVALIGASAMAVSPVMLLISEEARNYTLATLLVVCALWLMVRIARALLDGRPVPAMHWLAWTVVNAAACYAHYYALLAASAQGVALASLLYSRKRCRRADLGVWVSLAASLSGVLILFLPWMPTLAAHLQSPEQRWMTIWSPGSFVLDVLTSPALFVAAGPGASRLPILALPWVAAVAAFVIFIAFMTWRGSRLERADAESAPFTQLFAVFTAALVLELVAASIAARKDFLISPRYSFVYYPGFCAVLAATLTALPRISREFACGLLIAAGVLSAVAIDTNLAFEKSFYPDSMGDNVNARPPGLIVIGYNSFHEICTGLGYLIAAEHENPDWKSADFAFARRSWDYEAFWHRAAEAHVLWTSASALPATAAAGEWILAPGLDASDFPALLRRDKSACRLDPTTIFDTNNNVRDERGLWASRLRTTAHGSLYAWYDCASRAN
ncbi:MAG TPA: glycosyltransferase family 39 protein [Vicinamibacterales bacterium]|jgi:uncharacterized membrane protein|nr:glycosyltransferase family 39 protein [Vicinamibacterales bacterium]